MAPSILGAIGNTPLVELTSLSRFVGGTILAKCEHLNPGGSIKDRAAKSMVETAEREGMLKPGDTLVEGGGGNTAIGLALVAAAKGYRAIMTMPEATSIEKRRACELYGAEVVLCPGVPFSDERAYFHEAARLGRSAGMFFTNQFTNLANSQAHYETTAPELWQQTAGRLDAFVCSCGTGGTISGMASRLKELNPQVQCWIVDPPASGLLPLVRQGRGYETMESSPSAGLTRYSSDNSVRKVARSPGESPGFEGIGVDRVTANFARAFDAGLVDGALWGSSREAVEMVHYLQRTEGFAVGMSAALNVVGAVKLAQRLGSGSVVATVLCDGAERYASKAGSASWLEAQGLTPNPGATPAKFLETEPPNVAG